MDLSGRFPYLINAKLQSKPSNDDKINLFLTVRFGEGQLNYFIGTATIAISRVFLSLQLTNCTAPDEHWSFDKPRKAEIHTKTKIATKRKRQGGSAVNVKGSASFQKASADVGVKSLQAEQDYTEIRDAYDRVLALIVASGNERRPRWIIRASPTEFILEGAVLKDQMLCKLGIDGEPASVTLRAEFPVDGIVFRKSAKRFRIPTNKLSILQIFIRKAIRDETHELATLQLQANEQHEGQTVH